MTTTLKSFYSSLLPRFFTIIFILMSCVPALQAQFFNQHKFGKNRVQYQRFNWRFITTPNFEIYYYDGGYEIAQMTATYAEADFNQITDMVGFSPYNKTKLLIYNSIIDLQQSNIGINQQGFEVGGQTSFVRSEIEIAYTGSKSDFREELRLGIADVLIFELMYGGNLKEILQSTYLLNLPEWFMAGAASYISEGWTTEMDDYIRGLLMNGKTPKLSKLEGGKAKLVGQSIWNYIAEEYGRTNVASVLNLTRIVRNERTSIQNTLGIPYNTFVESWKQYYLKQKNDLEEQHISPKDEDSFKANGKGVVYNKVKISPRGTYIAYTENNKGRYKVMVRNLGSDKNKDQVILKGGYKVISQKVDYDIPLVSWRNDHELAIFASENGKNYLWLYDLEAKKNKKRKLLFKNFNQVKDFEVSPDGRLLAISADKRGKNDIYTYDIRRKKVTQITNDIFDDFNPRFMPNSKDILFSSNRTNDTLPSNETNLEKVTNNFNIFLYQADNKETLRRISNTLSKDTHPLPLDSKNIFYLSNQRGITHLYRYHLDDGVSFQITNYQLSIKDYDVAGGDFAMIMYHKGKEHIYHVKDLDIYTSTFTPKTFRQQVIDLRNLQKLKQKRARELEAQQQKSTSNPQNTDDTATKEEDTSNNEIDTDNYQFDTFSKGKRKSFLDKYKSKVKNQEETSILQVSKPLQYENRFAADNFITSLRIDPLRGWGLFFEVAMTDVLENHKINAGLFGSTNLNNSNFFAEYEYLKSRFDFRGRFERHNLERTGESFTYEFNMNRLEGSVSYPFNITSRLTLGGFYAFTRATNADLLSNSDNVTNYAGVNLEWVYDNSIITGMNMREGTRVKARVENHFGLSHSNIGFGSFIVDARNYQKLHKALVLATRISYGHFFGTARKNFSLGGADNWIFNSTNESGSDNPLNIDNINDGTDLLFNQFVAPMRGFEFNHWYGENYFVFNAELRFPILRYFYRGTINSNFFRNLQFIGFSDLGSAWTGINPLKEDNAINTEEIPQTGAFSATVKNFKAPYLFSYGVGVRTMMLGYYTKLDVAWGYEDGIRNSAKFHLTIGYDF